MTLSAHMVEIFIFPSDPILTIFHAMNFGEKFFDLDKKLLFMNFLKPENPIFVRSTHTADHSIDMLRVVT